MNTTREESPELVPEGEACPRDVYAQEFDRRTVVAQAKILVGQLDTYLDLIGEWALDETEDEDAGR